mgnify:CR=1 FL=1
MNSNLIIGKNGSNMERRPYINLEDSANKRIVDIPKRLSRITSDLEYHVDSEGYIVSHSSKLNEEGKYINKEGYDPRSLPLIHPTEWETIARMFAFSRFKLFNMNFKLLEIDASRIEITAHRIHPSLKHGEYFAKVQESAIISNKEYSWIKINPSFLATWPEFFQSHITRSKEFSPTLVNNK